MRELIIETIQFQVGSITQPLTRWAADYDLPVALIYKRYYSGLRGAELLAPTPSDILYYDDLKRLWGRKWVFSPSKRKPKNTKEIISYIYDNPELLSREK